MLLSRRRDRFYLSELVCYTATQMCCTLITLRFRYCSLVHVVSRYLTPTIMLRLVKLDIAYIAIYKDENDGPSIYVAGSKSHTVFVRHLLK